jgi:hypothetical protein
MNEMGKRRRWDGWEREEKMNRRGEEREEEKIGRRGRRKGREEDEYK